MTQNPFTFGNPIREPGHFIGRQEDVRQVANRLLSSAHESTSIVGERRIGKTSLLMHLADKSAASQMGLEPGRFCLIYIDFQGLIDITPQRFWGRVITRMGRTITDPNLRARIEALQKDNTYELFDLEDLCESITEAGLCVVLLLDEFEYVTQNPNFGADFFGGLRALAIHHNLPLVTATRRELIDLCHSEEIKGSPFFNIFANIVLRLFKQVEVDELLDCYTRESGVTFGTQEHELTWRLAGGHPLFTQVAGYYLFDGMQQGLPPDKLEKWVTAQFEQQAAPHFSYLWGRCTESEKITLLSTIMLCRSKPGKKDLPFMERLVKLYPRAAMDADHLIKRGLLREQDGDSECYALLSSSLEGWIMREMAAGPDEEASQVSVTEWLQSGRVTMDEPEKDLMMKVKKQYWPLFATILKEVSFGVAGNLTFELLMKGLL
ncbi:MAG TPA: AAA-like domain-containing protein [Anaerolineales bacterium]|nr:AAA-like domain-containing protein [Anaerolineales bacterium]